MNVPENRESVPADYVLAYDSSDLLEESIENAGILFYIEILNG